MINVTCSEHAARVTPILLLNKKSITLKELVHNQVYGYRDEFIFHFHFSVDFSKQTEQPLMRRRALQWDHSVCLDTRPRGLPT